MSIDGVWSSEIYGPFGWEARGVLVLERGRILGGGAGSVPPAAMNSRASISSPISRRTTMACRVPCLVEPFVSKLEGRIHEGVIDGTIVRPENSKYEAQIRLAKGMELPEH